MEFIVCQQKGMNSLTDLVTSAVNLGGGEASTAVWQKVAASLSDSIPYIAACGLQQQQQQQSP
jgi:hypothetical protein